MFLNILRISASNVLKMFLNIIVSIGCYFPFVQTSRKYKYDQFIELVATLVCKKKNIIINKKRFKTNLYVHNTKGDVATDEN